MFRLRLSYLFRSLCIACLILCAYAQMLYDNPPIGVPLTRPIFPWLARVYVKSGEQRTFLDAPPPNINGNDTQKPPPVQNGKQGQTQGPFGQPSPQQQGSPQSVLPPSSQPTPEQGQVQPYGMPLPQPQSQVPPHGQPYPSEFNGYSDAYSQVPPQNDQGIFLNVQFILGAQQSQAPNYGYPQRYGPQSSQDPQDMYKQQIQQQQAQYAQQQAQFAQQRAQYYAQQQQQQQQMQIQQFSQQSQAQMQPQYAPNPAQTSSYGPSMNPNGYPQAQTYGQPQPQLQPQYATPYAYQSAQSPWSRFSAVPPIQTQAKDPQLQSLPKPYLGMNSAAANAQQSYAQSYTMPQNDAIPYQTYDVQVSPGMNSNQAQTQQLSPLPILGSDPVLGPPPSAGVPDQAYSISYPGPQASEASFASNKQLINPGYFYSSLPSAPNRFHDYYQSSSERNVVETPFGTASTSTLSILKELAVALEKVTKNQ